MARRVISIDTKIEIAQKKVNSLKEKLNAAQADLDALMSKKNDAKKEELWAAIEKSEKTLDEIIDFVK